MKKTYNEYYKETKAEMYKYLSERTYQVNIDLWYHIDTNEFFTVDGTLTNTYSTAPVRLRICNSEGRGNHGILPGLCMYVGVVEQKTRKLYKW